MRLKSVEINGFKSFPDKTKLEFVKPITAVVGPNGSGKSNIGDAIRWVLGEQSSKTLRGAKMEDVIFGGTQRRKAQTSAQVTLTIDNADRSMDINYDEVSITRRINRLGDSEFKVNNNTVRLKDIHQLFMDTGLGRDGYSIIGQGKIAEIVSAKSKERREIFEEAAGIAKYRYHKIEAQRRLEQAEENLLRLNDILAELEARIEPLQKDSEKALKFIELDKKKKDIEISLWIKTLNKSKVLIKEQQNQIDLCRNNYDDIVNNLEKIDSNISEIFSNMQKCSVEMDNNRIEIKAMEDQVSDYLAKRAVALNDIEHNDRLILEMKNELSDLNISQDDVQKEIEVRKNQIENKEENLKTITEQRETLKKIITQESTKTSNLNNQVDTLKLRRATLYNKINDAKLNIATTTAIMEQSEKRLTELTNEHLQKEDNRKLILSEIENCTKLLSNISEKITELQNSKRGYELKLEGRQDKFDEYNQNKNNIIDQIRIKNQRSKLLADMEKSLDGFSSSVKFIYKSMQNGKLTGIEGTVSSVINVKAKYSLAIETALGNSMQNIIVSNEYIAKQSINLLKESKAGRATFLPMTSVKGKKADIGNIRKMDGFIGIASELVEFNDKYDGIIQNMLGRIIIVEDLDFATDIAQSNGYKFRIVTLDGQVINAGGSFTGGSATQNSGILSRRAEIEKLNEQALNLKINLEKNQQDIEKLSTEITAIKAKINAIDSEILTANEDNYSSKSELKRLELSENEAKNSKETALHEKQILVENLSKIKESNVLSISQLKKVTEELSQTELEISATNTEKSSLFSHMDEISQKLNDTNMEIVVISKDIEQLKESNSNLLMQNDNQLNKRTTLKNKYEELTDKNIEIKNDIEKYELNKSSYDTQITKLEENISMMMSQRTENERITTELRNTSKNVILEREKISSQLSRLEERKINMQMEYDSIIKKLWEEYELIKSEAEKIVIEIEDIPKSEKELSELKSKIKSLGHINLDSIDEFKEVNERYNFMKNQVDDVCKSKNQLNKLIDDLTSQMREIFSQQFNQINTNFKQIFVELFGGGKANLSLTEPDDVLESGIDIEVEPPGKLIKSLAALSGGEQSFVAVALYFAILKVNPSPFCILDEIEAALDDVNVTKYAKYLRKLSNNTQFIAITHRRGTMEEADVLYGVTMQEEGISKLLELKVSEIESKLGISEISV